MDHSLTTSKFSYLDPYMTSVSMYSHSFPVLQLRYTCWSHYDFIIPLRHPLPHQNHPLPCLLELLFHPPSPVVQWVLKFYLPHLLYLQQLFLFCLPMPHSSPSSILSSYCPSGCSSSFTITRTTWILVWSRTKIVNNPPHPKCSVMYVFYSLLFEMVIISHRLAHFTTTSIVNSVVFELICKARANHWCTDWEKSSFLACQSYF
jgi:hypothetical protein